MVVVRCCSYCLCKWREHARPPYIAAIADEIAICIARRVSGWTVTVTLGSAGSYMSVHAHFFRQTILTRKVGHTGLVFGVRSGFIGRSVHARWVTSLCVQRLITICATTVNIQTHAHKHIHRYTIWSAYIKSSASWATMYCHVQNLVIASEHPWCMHATSCALMKKYPLRLC